MLKERGGGRSLHGLRGWVLRIIAVIERDWLPDSGVDLFDRIRIWWGGRHVRDGVSAPPNWPQPWRNVLVDDVVAQTITCLEAEGPYRPVRAITVTYRDAPISERSTRRLRLRPDAGDFHDLSTMLEARKSIYRALVEEAESRGHQPPLSLHVVFQPGEPSRPGRRAIIGRKIRPEIAVHLGLAAHDGPRDEDPITVPTTDMTAEERGQIVRFRLTAATGERIDLELDELRPIGRLTSKDLGIKADEESHQLTIAAEDVERSIRLIGERIAEVRDELPALRGEELDDAQAELVDLGERLDRRRIALFDANRRVAGAVPQLIQFELRPKGRIRVRGVGCDVHQVGARKVLNVPRAKTTGGVTELVAGTSLRVDGRATLLVDSVEVDVA